MRCEPRRRNILVTEYYTRSTQNVAHESIVGDRDAARAAHPISSSDRSAVRADIATVCAPLMQQ